MAPALLEDPHNAGDTFHNYCMILTFCKTGEGGRKLLQLVGIIASIQLVGIIASILHSSLDTHTFPSVFLFGISEIACKAKRRLLHDDHITVLANVYK